MKRNVEYYSWLTSNNILNKVFQLFADIVLGLIRFFAKRSPLERRNVCIISIHKLGDSVFTFDAIYSVKKYYDTNVLIICSETALPVYELIIDKKFIIPLNKKFFHFNDRYADRRARRILRKLKPEIIIDLTGVMTSASLIFNSRAKKIIGFNRKIFRAVYDVYSEFNLGSHSREIYTNAIKKSIPTFEYRNFSVEHGLSKILKILICPFAGWKSKEWPFFKFIEIAELLSKKYKVLFILDNTTLNEQTLEYLDCNNINYKKTGSVNELIMEIKDSDLVIGNDSGPIQIAAALNKYTFTIYGPSNPKFHLPRGEKHFYVQKLIPCSPTNEERLCFTDGGKRGCPSFECLNTLTVTEVFDKLKKVLNKIEYDFN